ELNLPSYLVPIPHNSAAARTAAEPTNMRGIDSGNVFEPTGFIDTSESATAVFGDDIADEATTAHPPQGAPHREPLSFETRYDGPEHAAPPVQDPPRGLDGNIPGMPPPPGIAGAAGAAGAGAAGVGAAGLGQTPNHYPETRLTPQQASVPASQQQQPAQAPATAESEPSIKPLTNRSPVAFIVWLVVIGIIVAGVGLAGWWFGSGYYGGTPLFIR